MSKILDILVPQYNETEGMIKRLLDSIEIQQGINFSDIGVIIVNDGSSEQYYLSEDFLSSYSFDIKYLKTKHHGVSSARQCALDNSTADYVIFCDADDMFVLNIGIALILNEIKKNKNEPFDVLSSNYIEETKVFDDTMVYINKNINNVFVHGRVYRRKFLIDNNITWNEELKIHEDFYFNHLAITLSKKHLKTTKAFYLYKWRDDSVCRKDKFYLFNTRIDMLKSSSCLIQELLKRNKTKEARECICRIIFGEYYWSQNPLYSKEPKLNKQYEINREATKQFYKEFESYFLGCSEELLRKCAISEKTKAMNDYNIVFEKVSFYDWLKGEIKNDTANK